MVEFLSWIRYVQFTGDVTQLYLAKNEAQIEAQKRQQTGSDDEDIDTSDAFKGTSLKFMGIDLELKVWQAVTNVCLNQFKCYETTQQQDLEILETNMFNGVELTQNQRCGVLYRSGEKKILHFLMDAAENISKLFLMNLKNAKREVNSNAKKYEGCGDYIRLTVYDALQEKGNNK